MTFDDIYEMLESVRAYDLRVGECLIQVGSCDGLTFSYATASKEFKSVSWTMALRLAKSTALARARGTKEAQHIRELLSSFMGRSQLLRELREGTLHYGIAAPPRPPALFDPSPLADNLDAPVEVCYQARGLPRQCRIPGL